MEAIARPVARLRPPIRGLWPRMSASFILNKIDHEDADKLGYARLSSVPPEVLATSFGHAPGADRLWRSIFGARCELVIKRFFENAGKEVLWYEFVFDHEEVKRRRHQPDIIYLRLPLQIKGSFDWKNFYVRKDQIYPRQLYIHVYCGEFPRCEIMGWVLGQWLNDYGVERNHGAPGMFLDISHSIVRDVMELLWHPERILRETKCEWRNRYAA